MVQVQESTICGMCIFMCSAVCTCYRETILTHIFRNGVCLLVYVRFCKFLADGHTLAGANS